MQKILRTILGITGLRIIVYLCFLLPIIVDQLSKYYLSFFLNDVLGIQKILPIKLVLHFNKGIFGGFFTSFPSEVTPGLINIISITVFGFFFFFLILIEKFLDEKLISLRLYLYLFIGGITANVIDRLFRGYVIDFISVFPNWYFNFADCFIVFGAVFFLYYILKNYDTIWFPEDKRNKFLINKGYQYKFAIFLVFITVGQFIVSSLFAFSFLLNINNIHLTTLILFIIPFSLTITIYIAIVIIISFQISNKSAGPVWSFCRFVSLLKDNPLPSKPLILRKGDDFKKELEDSAALITEVINKNKK
ncbi:MAG: signal peptidase II [Oligoflexia bacterium]|nr:signal peptidase II [Oligoflexia bacterium]